MLVDLALDPVALTVQKELWNPGGNMPHQLADIILNIPDLTVPITMACALFIGKNFTYAMQQSA